MKCPRPTPTSFFSAFGCAHLRRPALLLGLVLLFAPGCAPDSAPAPGAEGETRTGSTAFTEGAAALPSGGQAGAVTLPKALVYKTPSCGCCNGWVDHLRDAGFEVDARNLNDIIPVKIDAGVPSRMSSCHTALIDGYVVEGHVPAEQVKRLLVDRPEIVGIAVPGMPIGSPGMEGPGARPYEVLSWDRYGNIQVFAEVDPLYCTRFFWTVD